MSKIEKIEAEIERRVAEITDICQGYIADKQMKAEYLLLHELLSFIDSLSDTEKDFGIKESVIPFGASNSELMEATYFIPQGYHAVIDGNKVIIKKGEEPVSNTILLYGLSGSVGIEEAVKETEEYKEWQGDPERQQSFIDFAKFGANYKHHTSNDLEEAATKYARKQLSNPDYPTYNDEYEMECAFEAGAQWQKEQDQFTIELAEDHAYLAGQEKVIAKACEWLENYFKGVSSGTVYLEDFKKAIKG